MKDLRIALFFSFGSYCSFFVADWFTLMNTLLDMSLEQLKNILLVGFQKYPGSLMDGFTRTQISTLAVKDGLMVAGGFQGELTCKVSL